MTWSVKSREDLGIFTRCEGCSPLITLNEKEPTFPVAIRYGGGGGANNVLSFL